MANGSLPEDGCSSSSKAAGPRQRGSGQHILYIDDDEALVDLAQRMLTTMGYRVSGFVNAEDGLAALRAAPSAFDIVVTDYNMPRISGLEVAATVAEVRADLTVLLTSGYVTDEMRKHAREARGLRLAEKPGTMQELCAVIADALENAKG